MRRAGASEFSSWASSWQMRSDPALLQSSCSNLRRLLNLVFDSPGRASVVAELQIHYRPILELKENEHHFFYGER